LYLDLDPDVNRITEALDEATLALPPFAPRFAAVRLRLYSLLVLAHGRRYRRA
jgi:hypothetical protein